MTAADVIAGAARWHVEQGDCLKVLDTIPDASIDAAILDPPGGIGFMGRDFDSDRGGRDAWIAWLTARLAQVRRVLKPGAALLCWAMPRTSGWTHRAIEDAGFAFDPVGMIIHAFGQGWNKSPDQLKPALEPWYFARAPLSEKTIAANRERWGVPYLGVEDCRVGTSKDVPASGSTRRPAGGPREGMGADTSGNNFNPNIGRRPSAFVLSHGEGCRIVGTKRVRNPSGDIADAGPRNNGVLGRDDKPRGDWTAYGGADGREEVEDWTCVEGCPVKLLDEQSGHLHGPGNLTPPKRPSSAVVYGGGRAGVIENYGDEGTASRFFAQFPPEPFAYCAKTAASERHAGCDALLWAADDGRPSGVRQVTREEWAALPENDRRQGNIHPTVKSLALMRRFVRLVCPPSGVVLDCFAGSGGTIAGALYEGRRAVAVEQDPDYATIARARAAFAARNVGRQFKAPRADRRPDGQRSLFGEAS